MYNLSEGRGLLRVGIPFLKIRLRGLRWLEAVNFIVHDNIVLNDLLIRTFDLVVIRFEGDFGIIFAASKCDTWLSSGARHGCHG